MILVNYHLPIVWISSNQKYLLLQNHFQLDKSYPFLKAIPHECQRTCKFEYLYSSFVSVFQMKQCILLTMQYFHLPRNIGPLVLSSTRFKRVTIKFHKNQRLNIGNQYHKDVTLIINGIIEKFDEPRDVIPHQIN